MWKNISESGNKNVVIYCCVFNAQFVQKENTYQRFVRGAVGALPIIMCISTF